MNSKAQYTKHFGKWQFRKNQKLSEQDGVFIGRRIAKRKEFQKDSEVYVNGIEYPPHKLRKAIYGKAYVPTMQSHRFPGGRSGSRKFQIMQLLKKIRISSFPEYPRGHRCLYPCNAQDAA